MASHSVGAITGGRVAAHKLEGMAWGLFFIWIGLAFLLNLAWGIGLLGVGVLMVGKQMARKYLGLQFETFWFVVGAFFILGGVWESFSLRISLIPILCIAAGAGLLVSALVAKSSE